MSIGWAAEGIDRARAAGGVELEKYRRPGFVAGIGVRRSDVYAGGCGIPVYVSYDEDFDDRLRSSRRPQGRSGR